MAAEGRDYNLWYGSRARTDYASRRYREAIWEVALARRFPDPDDYDDHWSFRDPAMCTLLSRDYRQCTRQRGNCEFERKMLLVCQAIRNEANIVAFEKTAIAIKARLKYEKAVDAASFKTSVEYVENLV